MSINSPNVFSAKNVSEHMYSSLPRGDALELRNPFDAVALLTHACMIAVGFRLVGLGENHKIGKALIITFCAAYSKNSQNQHPAMMARSLYLRNGMLQLLTTMPSAMHIPSPHYNISSRLAG